MKVITYQSPNGGTIDLSRKQIAMLEAARVWPRNECGEEYCTVSYGLHFGVPTMSDEEVAEMCGISVYEAVRLADPPAEVFIMDEGLPLMAK